MNLTCSSSRVVNIEFSVLPFPGDWTQLLSPDLTSLWLRRPEQRDFGPNNSETYPIEIRAERLP